MSVTAEPGDITRLLRAARSGDSEAFDRLFAVVYDALGAIARRQLRRQPGSTVCTTDLVHEIYLKLASGTSVDWKDRHHFFAVAARAMRQVLVDHARRRSVEERARARDGIALTDWQRSFHVGLDELLAVDEALERLDALSPRLRKVVELRFFGGMLEQEIADLHGVSARTVERDWTKARLFLHRELYPDADA